MSALVIDAGKLFFSKFHQLNSKTWYSSTKVQWKEFHKILLIRSFGRCLSKINCLICTIPKKKKKKNWKTLLTFFNNVEKLFRALWFSTNLETNLDADNILSIYFLLFYCYFNWKHCIYWQKSKSIWLNINFQMQEEK